MDSILLGQLDSNGDCLYATILARQLRHDHPDAHITWAISSRCVNVLRNNPDIDEIWQIPIAGESERLLAWHDFEVEANRRYRRAEFDFMLFSQINPSNFQNWDGTIRPSILRSYGRPITVPFENVISLTSEEIDRVDEFAKKEEIAKFENRILFECSSMSGQSFVTPDLAQEIARRIYEILPDTTVVFLTNLPMELKDPRSKYVGHLSLRECARLTHHCNLFLGSGSGGTVVVSSTASRPIPMMLMLLAKTSVYASFAHDFEYFGLTEREIVETTCEDPALLARGAVAILRQGMAQAPEVMPTGIPLHPAWYFFFVETFLLRRKFFVDAARSIAATAARYGWTMELLEFAAAKVLPNLHLDRAMQFSDNREFMDAFMERVAREALCPAPFLRQTPGAGKLLFRGDVA